VIQSVTLTEVFEEAQLLHLLARPDIVQSLSVDDAKDPEHTLKTGLYAQLQAYHRKSRKGQIKVTYKHAKRMKTGRLYAVGPSLQNFPRRIRLVLSTATLKDADFSNCNPSLLTQICAELSIPCPILDAYVADRKAHLRKLYIPYEQGKIAVLKIIFGGALDTQSTWLKSLHAECKVIRESLCKKFPETYRLLQHKQNAKASTLCRIVQDAENICLSAFREYVKKCGLTTRVLVYDGLMLEGDVPQDFYRGASEYILDATGYSITVLEKAINRMTVSQIAETLDMLEMEQEPDVTPVDTTHVYLEEGCFLNILAKYISCMAGMMMGKTEQTLRLVKQFKDLNKSVLFITQRVSMASTTYKRLKDKGIDIIHYQDHKGPLISAKHKYVICEYESMSRIEGTYDLIVLDEWRSIIETIQSPTNGLNTLKHWEKLKNFTLHAEKVLFLDADMEADAAAYKVQDMLTLHDAIVAGNALTAEARRMEKTTPYNKKEHEALILEAYRVSGNPAKVHRIVSNVHKMKRCNIISTSIEMLVKAADLLKAGKRIVLCCASIKVANMYAEYLAGYVDGEIGLYTSKTDNRDDLKNLEECWDKYQCIIFTSTITTGADYNSPIDTLFLFPWHNACTPRDMCQMAGRIRELTSGNIYVAVKEGTVVETTTREEIDKVFESHLQRLESCSQRLKDIMVNSSIQLQYTLPPATLARSYTQTPHDMLVIGAFASAERSFTISMQRWMSVYMLLCNNKGYTTRNDSKTLSEKETIDILVYLKKMSKNEKHVAACRMNAIDVEGFRTDHAGFRHLCGLANRQRFTIAEEEEFSMTYGYLDTSATGLQEAVQKATVARLFSKMDMSKISAPFVKTVLGAKRVLQLHHMHEHFANDCSRLTDFLMTMKNNDVPELRKPHIVPIYMYVNDLLASLGADGIHDRTTVIDSDRLVFQSRKVKRTLKAFADLGITPSQTAETDFEKAASIVERVLRLKVASGKPITMQPCLSNLMDLNPTIDPATWFNEKWGAEAPVKDHNSPHSMDTVSELTQLLALYNDFKGEMFDALRTDIRKRIDIVKSVGTKRQREYQSTEMDAYIQKHNKRQKDVDTARVSRPKANVQQKPAVTTQPNTKQRKIKSISIEKRGELLTRFDYPFNKTRYRYPGMTDEFRDARKQGRAKSRDEVNQTNIEWLDAATLTTGTMMITPHEERSNERQKMDALSKQLWHDIHNEQ
jgi:late competence protein required for DNA uptake (superfamily II DNA/RNA helicase)